MRITPIIASLFSLLLFLTAFGQPAPINRRAFALASLAAGAVNPNPTNALPTGIFLWWVASDMPTNVVVSNQWLDRVRSLPAAQMDTSKQPTNSNFGVYFSGSTYLTNTPIDLALGGANAWSVLMIAEQDAHVASQTLLWNNDGSGGAYGIGFYSGSGSAMYWSHFNSVFRSFNYSKPLNVLNDMLFTPTNASFVCAFSTNGIVTTGGINQNESIGFTLQSIGSDNLGANKYQGYIREIIIWTNVNSGFTTFNQSNIHWYSTNAYSTNLYGAHGIYP